MHRAGTECPEDQQIKRPLEKIEPSWIWRHCCRHPTTSYDFLMLNVNNNRNPCELKRRTAAMERLTADSDICGKSPVTRLYVQMRVLGPPTRCPPSAAWALPKEIGTIVARDQNEASNRIRALAPSGLDKLAIQKEIDVSR